MNGVRSFILNEAIIEDMKMDLKGGSTLGTMTRTDELQDETMRLVKIEMEVPIDLVPYLDLKTDRLKQYALLLYPYIQRGDISHGKAAEILRMNRLDLIDLYGEMELPYFCETEEELRSDLDTLKGLRSGV